MSSPNHRFILLILFMMAVPWTSYIEFCCTLYPGPGSSFRHMFGYYSAATLMNENGASALYDFDGQLNVQKRIAPTYFTLEVRNGYSFSPFIYPPYVIAPFVALSHITLPEAYQVWLASNLLAATGIALLLWKLSTTWQKHERVILLLYPFTHFSFVHIITAGQMTLWYTLGLLFGFWLLERKRAFTAGASLLLCAVKPHLFIGLFAGWMRIWPMRMFLALVLMGFSLLLATTFLMSGDIWPAYFRALSHLSGQTELYEANPDTMVNVKGLLTRFAPEFSTEDISKLCWQIWGVSVLAQMVLWWKYHARKSRGVLLALSLTMSLFFAPWMHRYDEFVLIFAGLLLYDFYRHTEYRRAFTGMVLLLHALAYPMYVYDTYGFLLMGMLFFFALKAMTMPKASGSVL